MSTRRYETVRAVPIPPNLSDVKRAEYLACREALFQLELEWLAVDNDDHPDFRACASLIEETKANRNQQADERLKLRLEAIALHAQRERERIAAEDKEAKALAKDRLLRAYAHSYQEICDQLKDAMARTGHDFAAFMATHAITFPRLPSDTQMRTRGQQSEAIPLQLSEDDCASDLNALMALCKE
jgi:hypothetical protein